MRPLHRVLLVTSIAAASAVSTSAAHAQGIPGLPAVHAVNASAQIGTVWPNEPSAPSTTLSDFDLWGWGIETEFYLPVADDSRWHGTLGLGTNHLNMSAEIGDGRRFRGSLRDLPMLSLYFGRTTNAWYFGASLGLSELKDGRIHTTPPPGTIDKGPIKVSGSTFSAGMAIGYEVGPVFLELGYVGRYFPSLAYDALPESGFPSDLDERLYTGGFVFRIGGTLGVTDPGKKTRKTEVPCGDGSVTIVSDPTRPTPVHQCTDGGLTITVPR